MVSYTLPIFLPPQTLQPRGSENLRGLSFDSLLPALVPCVLPGCATMTEDLDVFDSDDDELADCCFLTVAGPIPPKKSM